MKRSVPVIVPVPAEDQHRLARTKRAAADLRHAVLDQLPKHAHAQTHFEEPSAADERQPSSRRIATALGVAAAVAVAGLAGHWDQCKFAEHVFVLRHLVLVSGHTLSP